MTNRDKINQMSNKELANFMEILIDITSPSCDFCKFEFRDTDCEHSDCEDGMLKWLESEAEQC